MKVLRAVPTESLSEKLSVQRLSDALGVRNLRVNVFTLAEGSMSKHLHRDQEEVYLVLDGTALIDVDEEQFRVGEREVLAVPARASLLRCVHAPALGGDTMFANMYQAHDALSPGLRDMLAGLRAFNTLFSTRTLARRRRRPFGSIEEGELERQGGTWHPVLRRHEDSGRMALFVNEQMTDRFEGWTVEDSAPLLDHLFALATRPAYQYRHRWRPGDLIMWDNRCTQHFAPLDYDFANLDAPENRRLMLRSTLA